MRSRGQRENAYQKVWDATGWARRLVAASLAAVLPGFVLLACHLTDSLDGLATGQTTAPTDASTDRPSDGAAPDAGDSATDVGDASDDANVDGGDADAAEAGDTGGDVLGDTQTEADGPALPCGSGTCSGSCLDCDGDPGNGCETDVTSDPSNCGACGHDCDGYGCNAGVCEIALLVSDADLPWDLAVDDTAVFWVEEGPGPNEGSVHTVPLQGGASSTLAEGESTPIAVALDDAWVYWVSFASGGSVARVGKAGTDYAQLAVTNAPRSLALDAERVFWSTVEGAIMHLPKSGGTPTPLTQAGPGVCSVFVNEDHIYWTNRLSGDVSRLDKLDTTGASLTTVATSQSNPTAVYVDAQHVYWLEAGPSFDGADCFAASGRVLRTPHAQLGTIEEVASGQACPARITGDATHVYWTNQGTVEETTLAYRFDGSVARAAAGSTPAPEDVATTQLRPRGIALSDTSVFWVNRGLGLKQGTIQRTAK